MSSDGQPSSTPPKVLHLSCLLGGPVLTPDDRRVGELVDVIVMLQPVGYPPVSGLVVKVDDTDRFLGAGRVTSMSCDEVRLGADPGELGPFERRPGEVLLSRDLSARHLINVRSGRLMRANEIELADIRGRWEVIGVDPSSKPVFRRLLPRGLRNRIRPAGVVDWADIQPFVAHVPSARLQIPFRRLARLHPAQLADLVEAASHEEGEEIIRAVGADRELEADVFEELEPDRQLEFLRSRSDEEAARLLSSMAPDDAVDLLTEVDQERRLPILQKMPSATQRKVRTLLSYHPETAGGLMNPDFVGAPVTATVGEALAAVRASRVPAEASTVVYVGDQSGRLCGTALLVDLLRSNPAASLSTVSRADPAVLPPDADLHEVVRKMTDYNLAVAPVVDSEGRMLGQITVDDVLELMLPQGWRRQYGMVAPD